MAHANARTNLFGRRLIIERVAAGWPPGHVAEQFQRRITAGLTAGAVKG